jgi:Fe-S-cluster containining protein
VAKALARTSDEVDIADALRKAKRLGLLGSLIRVYETFPESNCDGCARCCFESPGIFFVEYLRLMESVDGMPQARRDTLIRRAVGELFFAWIDPKRTCIFLESSRCTVYAERPLACRLFGFVAPADREAAEVAARISAREEARRLARLGIAIPEEVVTRSLVSCDRVRDGHGRPVRQANADELASRVAKIDAALLPGDVVMHEFCFRSLPERLGVMWFGSSAVEMMRIDLLKRAQSGEKVDDLVGELRRMIKDAVRG